MHKVLLKNMFGKVFALMDVALGLLEHAYGMVDRSGEFVLKEVHGAVKVLKDSVDKAVDELP